MKYKKTNKAKIKKTFVEISKDALLPFRGLCLLKGKNYKEELENLMKNAVSKEMKKASTSEMN